MYRILRVVVSVGMIVGVFINAAIYMKTSGIQPLTLLQIDINRSKSLDHSGSGDIHTIPVNEEEDEEEEEEESDSKPSLLRKPRVLYGIEACSLPWSENAVGAILETWGSTVPRSDLIIVGSKYDDHHVLSGSPVLGGSTVDELRCADNKRALSCKEAVMIYRAMERMEKLDIDWLCVSQEDKYIWTEEVSTALKVFDAKTPQVFGGFGCGKSVNTCKPVFENGGLCGGATYFVSRGALDRLRKGNESMQAFVDDFTKPQGPSWTPGGDSDIAASCLFYDRGIPPTVAEKPFIYGLTGLHLDKNLHDLDVVDQHIAKHKHPLTVHLSVDKESLVSVIHRFADAGTTLSKMSAAAIRVREENVDEK